MAQSLNETLKPDLSYWLAYDESLVPHKFRVIKYKLVSETFYATEYGYISFRKERGHKAAHITLKGRKSITVLFPDEEVTEQDLLSLLVYCSVKPLFLAVPVPQTEQKQTQTQTEPLF